MSSKRRPRSPQEDAPRTSNKKKQSGTTTKRRDGTATLGKRAKACRNELRLLLFGITDGVPEFVQESSMVHGRTANPAELAASLGELAAWGRKVLASQDVLVVARCHRMDLGHELLEQAEVLAARVQSQLVLVGE
jgi:hypothetical protein